MNDDSALGTVRDSLTTAKDSLTEVRMSTPLDTIVRQRPGNTQAPQAHWPGRNRGGGGDRGAGRWPGQLRTTHGTGTIQTAAFTLVSNANGTATLTINPQVLLEPGTLQRDLAQDGIPAMVTVGSFCSSDPAPAGFLQVVSIPRSPLPFGSDRDVQSRRNASRNGAELR